MNRQHQSKAWAKPWLAASIAIFVVALNTRAGNSCMELVQTIHLRGKPGRLDHLALDGKGRRLFVANLSNNSLDIVDLKAGKLFKQIPRQRKIQGVAYAANLDRIFVGNGEDGLCNVFDGKDYSLLKSFTLPDADNVRYDPESSRIYVTHAENALTVLDAKTLQIETTIKLPGPPEGFQLDPVKARVFLNCTSPSQVVVIDTHKREVTANYTLERAKDNYPLVLDQKHNRVFVGCRTPALVLVFDAETGREAARIDIPGDVDDLFFDSKRNRLYATCGEGILAVIEQQDAGHYRLMEKIATTKQARTGLFDSETDRFYLVVPAHGGTGPEVRVYQAKP